MSHSSIVIRAERGDDRDAIHRVHASAFPTDAEARLVDQLRANGRATISLIAISNGAIVGHILFSPATIGNVKGLGLAPVAVSPAFQNRGIGSALVRAGLDACRAIQANFVVVLGHPTYYPRFGFRKASEIGIGNEYGADEAFMIIRMNEAAVSSPGVAEYAPEFADLA